MTYEQIKEYLAVILDMEKNIYIQENTLNKMYQKRNSLGKKRTIELPNCEKAETDYGEYMLTVGLIFGVIGFVIGLLVRWSEFWNNSGIFVIILAPLFGAFIALIAGIASAIVIGPFVALYISHKEQSEYNADYQWRMKEYDRLKSEDDKRMKNEYIIRSNLQEKIELFENKYKESKNRLDEFYNYNIIDKKYWYNIVAISSFYQYLAEKRTYSLEFDQKTGDRGAYNIYNEEAQRGVIIIQLGKVLDKLDQVIDNQQTLQDTLREANNKINYLSNNVSQMSRQITSSIQEQTAIEAYNAERTQAELGFINTMNSIYKWH